MRYQLFYLICNYHFNRIIFQTLGFMYRYSISYLEWDNCIGRLVIIIGTSKTINLESYNSVIISANANKLKSKIFCIHFIYWNIIHFDAK